MPRKSKTFLRRSAAAKKGWITRRRNIARAKHQAVPPHKPVIIRREYKPKQGRTVHIEIETVAGKRRRIWINNREYGPKEFKHLEHLLRVSKEVV